MLLLTYVIFSSGARIMLLLMFYMMYRFMHAVILYRHTKSEQKVYMADVAHNPAAGAGGQFPEFPATFTNGGQFIQYNIFGNMFEVTAKYRPPIMPIGRGAYGIVW